MDEKLNYFEASFLIVIVVISHIILEFPNVIIRSTLSASVINIIYITAIALVFFLIVAKLLKPFNGNNIMYVAEYVGGKTLKTILSSIYVCYFVFISSLIIRGFSETLKVVYFPKANTVFLIGSFILAATLAVILGYRNIIKVNTLLVPIILFTMIIVFFSSLKNFDTSRLFPILGKGTKETFINGITNLYTLGGLIYIFLVGSSLKNINDFKKVGILSIILSATYLLLSVVSSLILFPFLNTGNDVLSVYLSTRTIHFGNFLPRSDTIFMFVWIFNFLLYLCVVLLYIAKVCKENFKPQNQNIIPIISAIAIFILAFVPQNSAQILFLKNVVYKNLALFIVFILSPAVLIAGYIKKRINGL